MSRSFRWPLPCAIALAVATLASATLGLLTLSGRPTPVRFADVYDRRAFKLLEGTPSPTSLAAAEVDLRQALKLAPYNNSARLRLMYLGTVRHGAIGPDGVKLLAQSYDLVPLDHTVAAWRVKFALEHWRALTPAIREAVGKEVMAFGGSGSRDADVGSVLPGIQSPEGRVAASLWIMQLAR